MKKQSNEDGWWRFIKLCEKSAEKKLLPELFELFLTITEREEIGKRYLIVQELVNEKLPQREIAKKTNVSIAKITRGSNQLKTTSEKLRNFLKEIVK